MAAKRKRKAGADRLLPPEMWTEILSRLPAKSILRCRSVCKSWYSLISCPNFNSHYSLKTLYENGHRVLLQPYDDPCDIRACPFSSHDESFMESSDHDEVPEAFLGSNVEIVGSCNGLICLSKTDLNDVEATRFLIWNPTIRKVVELPSPSRVFYSLAPTFSYYGFGFDSKTGDYKVMSAHSSFRKDLCEIFDLKKGVWRRISPPVHSWDFRGRVPECYLDGAVHWSGYRYFASPERVLVSFHMSDEIFREIRLPDCAQLVRKDDGDNVDDDGYDDDSRMESRTVTFGGLIHVIVWKTESKRNGYTFDMNEECSVWAMKEYGVAESWTKLFNIDLLGYEAYRRIRPKKFRLWENGEVLMVHDRPEEEYDYNDDYDWYEHMIFGSGQELLLYNPESRECEQLFSFTKYISDMCLYEESLVLM